MSERYTLTELAELTALPPERVAAVLRAHRVPLSPSASGGEHAEREALVVALPALWAASAEARKAPKR